MWYKAVGRQLQKKVEAREHINPGCRICSEKETFYASCCIPASTNIGRHSSKSLLGSICTASDAGDNHSTKLNQDGPVSFKDVKNHASRCPD